MSAFSTCSSLPLLVSILILLIQEAFVVSQGISLFSALIFFPL